MALIPEVIGADVRFDEEIRGEEIGMNWWLFAALVVFDVYAASIAILAWAFSTAPLIPDSQPF